MKRIIEFTALVSLIPGMLFAGSGLNKTRPKESIHLGLPLSFVEGFPMIARIVVEPAGQFDTTDMLYDLGFGGGGIGFKIEREDGTTREVSTRFLSDDRFLCLPPRSLQNSLCDRPATIFMDIKDYLTLGWKNGTVTSQWKVQASLLDTSGIEHVLVRDPKDHEALVAERLCAGKSWFPTVALSDDPVPDASKLPAETRQIVKLIGILRSAVKSPDAGIKAIDDAKEEWGYLEPLMTFIRYECLLKLDRKDDAEKVRSRDPEFGRDLQFNLIDEGKGLVARLQALKAKQQAEKKE